MGNKNSKLEPHALAITTRGSELTATSSALPKKPTASTKHPQRKSFRRALKASLRRHSRKSKSNIAKDEIQPYITANFSVQSLHIQLWPSSSLTPAEPSDNGLYLTGSTTLASIASASNVTVSSNHTLPGNHEVEHSTAVPLALQHWVQQNRQAAASSGQNGLSQYAISRASSQKTPKVQNTLENDENLVPTMQEVEYNAPAVSDAPLAEVELLIELEQEALWQEEAEANPQTDEDHALALQVQADIALEAVTPATRDCAVCGEMTPIPELPALMACIHPPQTCAECFAVWIAVELETKGWKDIKCPEIDCVEIIQHIEVQLIATPEIFQRYDRLSTREVINDDPDWKWCLRPGCPSGQSHPGGADEPLITCIECEFQMCATHNREWHEGETCEEYDYRVSGQKERDQAAQEAASQAAVNQLSKKCPGKKCAYNIEKNEGCDHMTCSKCRYEFCWECYADYNAIRRSGNSAHKKGCKYRA